MILSASLLYADHLPSPVPTFSPFPAPPSSPAPSPVFSPSPVASPVVALPLGHRSIKIFCSESFLKAQRSEIRAAQHRHQFELKELKVSQDIREKEWKKTEADARHRFFETHTKGPDRRIYIQDFIQRREIFYKHLEERVQKKRATYRSHSQGTGSSFGRFQESD